MPADDPVIDLPYAYGPPPADGLLRQTPEDFNVEEELGFEPEGEGEHLWVWLEKRGMNTDQVARQLARLAGVFHNLSEIEINPYIVGRGNDPSGAVDVRVVIGG